MRINAPFFFSSPLSSYKERSYSPNSEEAFLRANLQSRRFSPRGKILFSLYQHDDVFYGCCFALPKASSSSSLYISVFTPRLEIDHWMSDISKYRRSYAIENRLVRVRFLVIGLKKRDRDEFSSRSRHPDRCFTWRQFLVWPNMMNDTKWSWERFIQRTMQKNEEGIRKTGSNQYLLRKASRREGERKFFFHMDLLCSYRFVLS